MGEPSCRLSLIHLVLPTVEPHYDFIKASLEKTGYRLLLHHAWEVFFVNLSPWGARARAGTKSARKSVFLCALKPLFCLFRPHYSRCYSSSFGFERRSVKGSNRSLLASRVDVRLYYVQLMREIPAQSGRRKASVSYTHLTLPTKRIV